MCAMCVIDSIVASYEERIEALEKRIQELESEASRNLDEQLRAARESTASLLVAISEGASAKKSAAGG